MAGAVRRSRTDFIDSKLQFCNIDDTGAQTIM